MSAQQARSLPWPMYNCPSGGQPLPPWLSSPPPRPLCCRIPRLWSGRGWSAGRPSLPCLAGVQLSLPTCEPPPGGGPASAAAGSVSTTTSVYRDQGWGGCQATREPVEGSDGGGEPWPGEVAQRWTVQAQGSRVHVFTL